MRTESRKITVVLIALLMAITTTITAYAVEPTQEEIDTFEAAMALYRESNGVGYEPPFPYDPEDPPTPPDFDAIKLQALTAFSDFLTTYPDSELCVMAQVYIGQCYNELKDYVNARTEFNKIVTDYPDTPFIDDAKYKVAFIDFRTGEYETALTGFEGIITDYENNTDERLSHKVPFAYFMVGECYRKLNDMLSAQTKWNELIIKYPTHSQAGRAKKRLDQ